MKTRFWFPISAILVLCFCSVALADPIVFELGVTFSGTPPTGTSPWLTATISDVTDGVEIELSAANLVNAEYVSQWYFNVDPFPSSTPDVDVRIGNTAPAPVSITWDQDKLKADGDGYFDLLFDFPTDAANRFGAGDLITLFIEGLTVDDFNFGSVKGGGAGTYFSAAHVQSIGAYSGWIGDSNGNEPGPGPLPVPEPTSIILLGLGLVGIGIGGRMRRK